MNRKERRQVKAEQKRHAERMPQALTPVPEREWPSHIQPRPIKVWRSSKYLVQVYDEPRPGDFAKQYRGLLRMSVNRSQIGVNGRWKDGLTWDELQSIKSEIGLGDWYGVEVYPRDGDVVNDANIRHIWLIPFPLLIGWRRETPDEVASDAR
jgi:hypothetical protein